MPLLRLSLPEIFSVRCGPVSRFCLCLLIACAFNGAPAYAQVSSEENPQNVAKASPSPAKSPTPKPKASPKKKKATAKKTPIAIKEKEESEGVAESLAKKENESVAHSVTEKIAVADPGSAGGGGARAAPNPNTFPHAGGYRSANDCERHHSTGRC